MQQPDDARRVFPVPWITEAGVVGFFTLILGLLIVHPHYDPITRYISEYAVGPGGWVARTAFVLLGLASLNLVPGFLGAGAPARGRRVAVSLGVWGAAVLTAAAFPVDPQGQAVTPTGTVHLVASFVGFAALIAAMALAVGSFRATDGWRDFARPTRWAAIMTPTAFLLEASVFVSLGWVGLGQWLLFGVAGAWLLAVARRFGSVRRAGTADR
ncbi:MAG: DUF998 domain-containing protein [Candidatus Longimicrobiales bacterium M2_2A_002]